MSESTQMPLTTFLLARIAEDEAVAQAMPGGAFIQDQPALGDFLVAYAPGRMLAECEAKRRIVCGEHERIARSRIPDEFRATFVNPDGSPVMYALAAVYADHPDYRNEWRP